VVIALYGGVLTERALLDSFVNTNPMFARSYLATVSVTYSAYRFQAAPIVLEFDFAAAKRFGVDHEWEVAAQPVLRWTWFPWNDFIYTTLRSAPLGLSYASGVSPWELHWAGNDHGSRLLNFLSAELTFKASAEAPGEIFLKSHHRSGIMGTFNNTYGGSTYTAIGYRVQF